MSTPTGPTADGPDRADRGVSRIRRQVSVLRVLTIVSLVLIIVIGVWSIVGIMSLSSQVSSLSAKVDALSVRAPDTSPSSAARGADPSAAPSAPAAPAMDEVPTPTGANAQGAVVVGDARATNVVEVYADYQCPYCQRWESEIGTTLMERALEPGSNLAVHQYNMAFLGESNRRLDPPGASARAANAAACVLDFDGVDAFVNFNRALFAMPAGASSATRFDTASLLGVASQSGAGEEAFGCIEGESFMPFVSETTQVAFARGVTGTPTVLVNGTPLQDPFGDPSLLALLGRAS